MSWPNVVLSGEQRSKLHEWLSKKEAANVGAIGGRYVYSCCPTSLGQVLKVRDDVSKDEIDLTDYESW